MKKIYREILSAVFAFIFLFGPVLAANAIPVVDPGGAGNPAFSPKTFEKILENIANFITGLVAVLAIIFLVYGGLRYVTAGGDETMMETAKTTITYALWGLFIAGVAFAVTKLIINKIINGETLV